MSLQQPEWPMKGFLWTLCQWDIRLSSIAFCKNLITRGARHPGNYNIQTIQAKELLKWCDGTLLRCRTSLECHPWNLNVLMSFVFGGLLYKPQWCSMYQLEYMCKFWRHLTAKLVKSTDILVVYAFLVEIGGGKNYGKTVMGKICCKHNSTGRPLVTSHRSPGVAPPSTQIIFSRLTSISKCHLAGLPQ